jgi:DNA helicase HerA-like ATPase
LSEARKYQLSLNIAHQFIKQLDEKIKDAVFGNVGTKCVFRVGIEDAEFLEQQFLPHFSKSDISDLPNYNALIALLVNGKPVRPFNFQTMAPGQRNFEQVETLKQRSFERYGKPKDEVDKEIMDRYLPPKPDPNAMPDPFAGGFPQF